MSNAEIRWRERVGRVFNTRPRIGVGKSRIWLSRRKEMQSFRQNFYNPGTHVCLDGPSGAGKTSLALTFLVQEGIRYAYVPLTRGMTWLDLCRLLLKPVDNTELGVSADVEVGIDKGLPSGKLRVSLGGKHRPTDDVDYVTKRAAMWTEHHVVEAVCEQQIALVIDDAERASQDLLLRLADLCKLMTMRSTPLCVKLCFIGTGDLFRRLLHSNVSLDQRVHQTTLGAFDDHRYSWHFLTIGFENLRLRHPGVSPLPEERGKLGQCMDSVYDAADGLPKSLNALGQRIAVGIGWNKSEVFAEDILFAARQVVEQNWLQYSRDFPRVLRVLDEHSMCRAIVRALYREGIARVHYANDLYVALADEAKADKTPLSEALVRDGLERLAAIDFLVLTGGAGEVVYVTRPTAAHALGVTMRDQHRAGAVGGNLRDREAVSDSFPRQTFRDGNVPGVDAA
jgi:thiamine monophosphate kinase